MASAEQLQAFERFTDAMARHRKVMAELLEASRELGAECWPLEMLYFPGDNSQYLIHALTDEELLRLLRHAVGVVERGEHRRNRQTIPL